MSYKLFETKQEEWLTRDGHIKSTVDLVAVSLKEPYHAGWMLATEAADLLDAHNKGAEIVLIVFDHENKPNAFEGVITGHKGIGSDGSERIELELTQRAEEVTAHE
jgi:hypothetical protein